jgi:hypothetical protein
MRSFHAAVIAGSIAMGAAGVIVVARLGGLMVVSGGSLALGVATLVMLIAAIVAVRAARTHKGAADLHAIGLATLVVFATTLVLAMLVQNAFYLSLPVDLLSFAESPFINDILKLRLGDPIYTPPGDNNSYPYTPGAPLLTYGLAVLVGLGDSIPAMRTIQFGYVVLAAAVATGVVDMLARIALASGDLKHRPVWLVFSALFLLLAATDARFNPYVHSLHNDGLALLISVTCYWVLVRHALTRRAWLLGAMAVLPALGFLVKQNHLLWAGVFAVYLIAVGGVPRRHVLGYLTGVALAVAAAVVTCVALWGDAFLWWVFVGLGAKQVSPFRTILHLFDAGAYGIMGLLAAWSLVLARPNRTTTALWISWVTVFLLQVYTSGVAWVTNHIGPSAVIAACWGLVAVMRVWPRPLGGTWWRATHEAVAVGVMLLLFGVLGFVREPRNPIPADFARYVADIEREFEGLPPDRVLLDHGTWIYYRHGIIAKDRSAPVALHAGQNQPTINHAALVDTIDRIERQAYDRVLARQLDTDQSAYDYDNRGSGVKAAILSRYHEVRRIPAVEGISRWWPLHMVSEIIVLEPSGSPAEAPD